MIDNNNVIKKESLSNGKGFVKNGNAPALIRETSEENIDGNLTNVSHGDLHKSQNSSIVDLGGEPDQGLLQTQESKVQQQYSTTEQVSECEPPTSAASADHYIKSAIPSLPLAVALVLCLLNVLLPGVGTILCGFTVICCGKPRLQTKDGQDVQTICVNMWVGVAQMFTVTFMLVGWFWSLVWGIYMVILAVDQRKQKKMQETKQIQANAVTTMDSRIRPWMLKTAE